ncbi:CD48 antigen-like isoform X3 [Neoarius graeffei]|uniref:CD48 antigen-like isoform X3 n=1 Tax=Neoarius graeffei TaxID=443677 RepID=UPI00298C41E7|nr:CD48 antigen-like isoform X3 [Neoarius graeffei]
MWTFNGYCLYIFVILIFGNLQGVCVVLADTVMVLKAGSSLDLPLKYPVESGLLVQWAFNKSAFAEYSADQNYTFLDSQFTGRLKGDDDKVGVTVQDLRPQDSGTFVVTANSINTQYPTQIFKVYIQSPITAVQIEKSQTWLTSTNSCEVVVKCAAPGAERVSYSWSGYQIASEAQLQFSLSPAEGAVTLNCTAANSISYGSATETLSCEQNKTNSSTLEVGNTLYADVNAGPTAHKDKRSDSFVNGMTVYETVDDLRVNPEMTIYAKVTLPQQTKVSATSSSPYQKVL